MNTFSLAIRVWLACGSQQAVSGFRNAIFYVGWKILIFVNGDSQVLNFVFPFDRWISKLNIFVSLYLFIAKHDCCGLTWIDDNYFPLMESLNITISTIDCKILIAQELVLLTV